MAEYWQGETACEVCGGDKDDQGYDHEWDCPIEMGL